ncbi:unnamed protein product [Linum trigynum]|uniref:Uncharacterized protein n=1 Tax=Linum trigynum TaxID=586398 RepID=A0AAV2CI17_9ROSI
MAQRLHFNYSSAPPYRRSLRPTAASTLAAQPADVQIDTRGPTRVPRTRLKKNVIVASPRTSNTLPPDKRQYQQATYEPCASMEQRLPFNYSSAPPYRRSLRPTAASTLAAQLADVQIDTRGPTRVPRTRLKKMSSP